MQFFNCPLCKNRSRLAFSELVLARYEGQYCLCEKCGLLFANEPNWLDEAYQFPIAQMDTGIIRRNLLNCLRLSIILCTLFNFKGKFLDYAGGSGLFTRLMRDIGFDFYWLDKYCSNVLAGGFEHIPNTKYTAVTAFEVLEHIPDPNTFINSLINETGCESFIFSTTTFKNKPPATNWTYYAFESGQHVCFYQRRTLEYLAGKFGMRYIYGGDLHIFTKKTISPLWFRFLTSHWGLALLPITLLFIKSRTKSDFTLLRKRLSITNRNRTKLN